MNSKTLAALKGSIRKWERIVKGTGVDKGVDNCPLCKLFYKRFDFFGTCNGCPVRNRTKQTMCKGSPYRTFALHSHQAEPDATKVKAAATRELEFLRSLLPKAKKKAI